MERLLALCDGREPDLVRDLRIGDFARVVDALLMDTESRKRLDLLEGEGEWWTRDEHGRPYGGWQPSWPLDDVGHRLGDELLDLLERRYDVTLPCLRGRWEDLGYDWRDAYVTGRL